MDKHTDENDNRRTDNSGFGWFGITMILIVFIGMMSWCDQELQCDQRILHLTGTADVPSYYPPPTTDATNP